MGFNFGSSAGGAVQGGMMGARTGNPYVAAIAAIANGLLGGFSKRDKETGEAKNWAATGSDLVSSVGSMGSMAGGVGGGGGAGSFLSSSELARQNKMNGVGGGGGFNADIISKALSSFGFGGDDGQEQEPTSPVLNPMGSVPAIPPTLMGFPSMNAPRVSSLLRETLKARRGF